jgi:hypothetical protein
VNVQDLTKDEQAQLDDARAWVDQQQEALTELRPAMDALVEAGSKDDLHPRHRKTIARIMRWDDDDYAEFFATDSITHDSEGEELETPIPRLSVEERLSRTFRAPMAYFYVDHKGKRYQVYVEQGKPTEIRDEDHLRYEE